MKQLQRFRYIVCYTVEQCIWLQTWRGTYCSLTISFHVINTIMNLNQGGAQCGKEKLYIESAYFKQPEVSNYIKSTEQ